MNPAGTVTAVVAAAGSGQRLGAGGPKAFVPVAGRPLVEWSLAALRAADDVAAIVVACPPTQASPSQAPERGRTSLHLLEESATSPGGGGVWEGVTVVDGGATRAISVANALAAVETELVAIHDAARPLLTPELLAGVVATLRADPGAAGAIAATPVTDTIKRVAAPEEPPTATRPTSSPYLGSDAGRAIVETVDRGSLWAAQTPQAFRVEALRAVLAADPAAVERATDEAMLVEAAGGRVLIHPAPAENFKVTTPLDLSLAELLLGRRGGAGDARR